MYIKAYNYTTFYFSMFDQIAYLHLCRYASGPWMLSGARFSVLASFFDTESTASLLLWDCITPVVLDGCPYEMPMLSLIQIWAMLIHRVFPSPSYRMGWNTSGLWHWEGDLFRNEVKGSLKDLLAPPDSFHKALCLSWQPTCSQNELPHYSAKRSSKCLHNLKMESAIILHMNQNTNCTSWAMLNAYQWPNHII